MGKKSQGKDLQLSKNRSGSQNAIYSSSDWNYTSFGNTKEAKGKCHLPIQPIEKGKRKEGSKAKSTSGSSNANKENMEPNASMMAKRPN